MTLEEVIFFIACRMAAAEQSGNVAEYILMRKVQSFLIELKERREAE